MKQEKQEKQSMRCDSANFVKFKHQHQTANNLKNPNFYQYYMFISLVGIISRFSIFK